MSFCNFAELYLCFVRLLDLSELYRTDEAELKISERTKGNEYLRDFSEKFYSDANPRGCA